MRLQQRRTRGWRKPDGAISVARPSRWGNPFGVDDHGRDLSVALYRAMITGRWDPDLFAHCSDAQHAAAAAARDAWTVRLGPAHPIDEVTSLAGHDLMCWCPTTLACHADVLLDLANDPPGR